MKEISKLRSLYSIRGYANSTNFTNFKTDLFANGSTPAITMDTDTTNGISVTGATTTAIRVTGSATTALSILTGTFGTGINIAGTTTTGLTVGACTTALRVTGACTTALSISGASTTAAIDITAASGRAIRIGTKGTTYANSTALSISSIGGVLDTDPANNYMVGVFTKVSTSESTTSTDDLTSAWFRTRVDKGMTIGAGYSLSGIKSQLRIYADTALATSISNWAAAGLLGVLEVSGATTTFASGSVAAAVYANVALTTTTVIASGAVVAGVVINNASAAITNTGNAYYGLYIQDYSGSSVDFNAAIKVINSCAVVGADFSGTLVNATSARAIKSVVTQANANHGDGYGVNEFDLTLTGTVAGHISPLSSWIEAITVTTGANLICSQTNGIYSEGGAVLTNSTIIFGMRMQCLCHVNGGVSGTTFYPFSIVNNTNITTALIQCNAASSDLGVTAVSKTTTGTYMPIYKDGTGVKYVLLYS